MAYTPIQPNSGAQTGTPYKAAIEGSIGAMFRLAAMFAPHEQNTPNMTVRLDAGAVLVNNALTEVAPQSTGTITAPAATYSRIDRVVIDAITGAVSVITGTPIVGTPVAPAITTGKLPVCRILLASSTTAITNSLITDERMPGGGGGAGFASNAEAKAGTVTDKTVAPNQLQYGVPVGVISAFGGSAAPTGYLLCNGAAVSRATYSDLFTAISTAFGVGDGSTTFNLPDLRQRFPLGKAASGTGATLGGTGGNVDHTHTTPASVFDTQSSGQSNLAVLHDGSPVAVTMLAMQAGYLPNVVTGNTGTGNPPFQVVNYIIKF